MLERPESSPYQDSTCPNCNEPLTAAAKYCSVCGQKQGIKRVPLHVILGDFFDSVFNLNSKFFRSLTQLFIPGYLTTQYFAGKRDRYFNPLRLFFVTLVIMYAVLGFTYLGELESQIIDQSPYRSYQTNLEARKLIRNTAATLWKDTLSDEKQEVIDTLLQNISHSYWEDALKLPLTLRRDTTVTLIPEEAYGMDIDSLCLKYGIETFFGRLMTKQLIRTYREPGKVLNSGIANTSWMIILLMPALAFVLKLLFIRRNMYFVQHLVFLFHFHAAVFVAMIVSIPFFGIMPSWALVAIPCVCLVSLYAWMKAYYRQGWAKTFVKYILLLFAYTGILLVFILATALVSILIFQ